ncbi:MAG: hypothetical protein JW940_07425 [Polyangiaceae bacterium]|nr:hypothetical protein [Polyangiaceae bacterium]
MSPLEHSVALWNRSRLDLASDEVLAQIIDRGTMDDWRELYQLAVGSPELRRRIHRLILAVPLPLPHFWLAALRSAGEDVDVGVRTPDYWSGP